MNERELQLLEIQISGNRSGELISLQDVEISPELLSQFTNIFVDCFGHSDTAVYRPTAIYCILVDDELASTAAVTPMLQPGNYYIYNVCTFSKYRRQKLSRTLFQLLPSAVYYLEVEPENVPAYRLYIGLGFVMMGISQRNAHVLRAEL